MSEGKKNGGDEIRRSERNADRRTIDYSILNTVGKERQEEYSEQGAGELDLDNPVRSPSIQASGGLPFAFGRGRSIDRDRELMADEKAKLRREMAELGEREAMLREEKELQAMRREVEERRRVVGGLEVSVKESTVKAADGKKKADGKKSGSGKKEGGNTITIDTLRDSEKLKQQVRRELAKLGLVDPVGVESDSSESDSSDSSASYSETDEDDDVSNVSKSHKKSKNKKKKSKKSGIEAKVSDNVKFKQQYPQAHLRFDFASKSLTFNKLDLNLFVAGELEIIAVCKDKKERNGRIDLLKRLMYLHTL